MSALVRRCPERLVSGRAGKRCRGQRRSIVLAVEVRGFILVVDMGARMDGKNSGDEGEGEDGANVLY